MRVGMITEDIQAGGLALDGIRLQIAGAGATVGVVNGTLLPPTGDGASVAALVRQHDNHALFQARLQEGLNHLGNGLSYVNHAEKAHTALESVNAAGLTAVM